MQSEKRKLSFRFLLIRTGGSGGKVRLALLKGIEITQKYFQIKFTKGKEENLC